MKLRNLFFVTVAFVCLLFGSCAKDVIDLTGAIKGSVKNANGAFVEDCIISLNPTGKSQVTSINGTFEFSKLDPNNYTLTFRKDGYSDQQKRVEVLSGMISNIDVILEYAYGTIKGTVKDEKDGHTIENCQISLSPGGISKMTGADGVFVFDNLSAGIYTLTYRKEGYADQTKSITVVAGKSVDADVALKQAYGSIKGTVRDMDDRHAIENCLISVSPSDRSSMTTADGAFEFTKLLVGDYTLVFERAGYSRATRETKVTGGDIIDLGEVWLKLENPFAVSQNTINFYKTEEVKTFTIHNNCDGNCTFEFSGIPTWLSITPQQGTIEKQSEKEVRLTVNRDKADYGEHTKDIKLSYEGRATGEIPIKVIMEKVKLTQPEVTISNPEKITVSGFDISGNIVNTGGSPILDYGHCWSRNENPTIEDHTNSLGECDKEKSFTSSITGLESYTTYYVRAYARNAQGISYSKQLEVITLDSRTKPEVSISSYATNILETAFDITGNIVSTGELMITEYGHCWNIYGAPTINDKKTNLGERDNSGSFTSNITNLEANTTYHVRAYAVNSKGTSYSKEITVTTKRPLSEPEVTISNATNITETGFDIGGSIVSTGGLTVTNYGHCWSTNENPTINDNKSNLGQRSSTGPFTSNITNLENATTYYVRAYAENEKGISYSEQRKVTTLEGYSNKWDGNIAFSFAGGSGTKTNPYIIENGGQLLLMKDYSSSYFKLANDIDLDNHNWLPFEFRGELDGNNCTIYNLRIERNNEFLGLFSILSGKVENMTINGVSIRGKTIGGIIGCMTDEAVIQDCHVILNSESQLLGDVFVGGIVGRIGTDDYDQNVSVEITGCTVRSNEDKYLLLGNDGAGGIIGGVYLSHYGTVEFDVSSCFASCNIMGDENIGGIIGSVDVYSARDKIQKCEYEGELSGTERVGGILGYYSGRTSGGSSANGSNLTISSCKATADIKVEKGFAGGILGATEEYAGCSIITSYSSGTLNDDENNGSIGGIVGDCYDKYRNYIYIYMSYSTVTSPQSTFKGIGNCKSKSECAYVADYTDITTYFKELYSNYASYWNFNNQWTWSGTVNGQNKQVKCPRLAWE